MAKEHPSAFRKSFKNFYLISACISIAFIFQIIQVVSEECGVINVHRPLILGGNEIQRGDFPFIVVVLYKDSPEYRCGGTVLSKMHILTGSSSKLTFSQGVETSNLKSYFSCTLRSLKELL